jgi:hypothetical protein
MAITYCIIHPRRLVVATSREALTDRDLFDYQTTVWSRKDVAGYDELVDTTDVVTIVRASAERVRDLASLAARMESSNSNSKFAIIAPSDLAFGLGRMFQAMRGFAGGNLRQVEVFRTAEEAMSFLELDENTTVHGLMLEGTVDAPSRCRVHA